jgi:two-component system sensor histidine kinase KdpD
VRFLDSLVSLPIASRLALATVGVLLAAGAAAVYGADAEQAALLLILAVMFGALQGRVVGWYSAILGAVVMDAGFTPPRGTLRIATADDVVVLLAFVIVAALISAVVATVSEARRSADRRAREAVLALDLAATWGGVEETDTVTRQAADALVELFGFVRVDLTVTGSKMTTGRGVDLGATNEAAGEVVRIDSPSVRLEAVAARGYPLTGDDRAVLESLVASLSAAIERITAEREAEAARVAAEVSRTRAGLLSAVSHNLRTPLAAIRAATSALLSDAATLDETDRVELLETVHSESIRLENLVAKVLDLGRIRAGGLELVAQPVDLGGLLQAAIHRLKPLLGTRVVTLDVGPDLDDVELDPEALEHVMLNLLENAVHYAPADTPVEIEAQRRRGVLEIRVVDHGPGIDESERERVFEEFYRAGQRAESEGTGLGLAIVKATVAAHRGRVWVEATPGGGATFVVRLPRVLEA